MSVGDIPVRVVGPGTQDIGDKPLSYLPMPGSMTTYTSPHIADAGQILEMAGVRETTDWLRQALADCARGGCSARADLSALDAASRDIVNQILGEGEVSVTYRGGFSARTQESVLAGVWRTFCFDEDGSPIADLIEVGDAPRQLRSPEGRDRPLDTSADGVAGELTNALSILVEAEAHVETYASAGTPGVINLSLLPLSDEEVEFLDERLGRGPADVLSRAYGKCQVISTRSENVWWVRYYNSMSTLILNTIEIVDVPQVVCAAPEDIRDSGLRLEEILSPYALGRA